MDRREVLRRAGGQRAVELAQRLGGRERLRALDQRALELAAQVALELAQLLLRHGVRVRRLGGLAAQLQRATDALHVDANHAGALSLSAEGGDRQAREVAHLAVRPLADGLADALAQSVEVERISPAEALLLEAPLDGLGLDGAEEEAVEDQLEDAAVLLRLGDRRGQRLLEVLLFGPGDEPKRLEGVEQLARAHLHALLAELVGEVEQARREAGRPGLGQPAVDRLAGARPRTRWLSRTRRARGFHRRASRRRARRPGRGRCGASR